MKKHSLPGFMAKSVACGAAGGVAISSIVSHNNFDLLYLKQHQQELEERREVEIVYKEHIEDSQTSIGMTGGTSGGINSKTSLNLALISQLNEGYIKEILTMYASLSNGELTDYEHHVSVEALLGMQLVETGYYGDSVGKLPKSYLPYDENGVIWNRGVKSLLAPDMTLAKFGDNQWTTYAGDANALCSWAGDHWIGNTLVRSPFQIESQLTIPAKVPNASTANKVDQHLFANLLTWVDNQYNAMIKNNNVKVDELSQYQLDCLASTTHNRGTSAARTMPYGIAYSTKGAFNSKLPAEYNETDKDAYNIICESFSKYMEKDKIGDLIKLLNPEAPKWAAIAIACHDDWFFTETLKTYTENHLDQLQVAWSILYPEENVTAEYCMQQVASRTTTLPSAITKVTKTSISGQETTNVYGTAGDFSEGGYNSRGYMFKVVNKRSSKYANKYSDGSNPYMVASYEILTAGHNFSCSILGSYWYAYLLRLGGLTSVDPTDPSTYLNNLGAELTGEIPSQFQDIIDSGSISELRSLLIKAAYSQVGKAGYYYAHSKENEYFDCSRFIMWCYSKIGINISFTTTSLYNSLGGNSSYRQVNLQEARAGDLLLCRGHVMMFIAYKNNKLYAIDCGGGGPDTGYIAPSEKKGVRYGYRGRITVETSTTGETKTFPAVSGSETLADGTQVVALNDSQRYYKIVRVTALESVDSTEQSTYTPQSLMPSFNTVTGTRVSLSDAEMLWMYKIVAAEAQGEPLEGKIAVAEVILNRVDSASFPNDVYSVIFAPGQFAPASSGTIHSAYAKCSDTTKQSIEKAVSAAINGSNYSGGALFFKTKSYHSGRTPTVQIGNHYFSK